MAPFDFGRGAASKEEIVKNGPNLSPRQLVCIRLVGEGKSSAEIAHILGLSARTVDQHIAIACKRLCVRRRVQAVARALGCGLITYGPAPVDIL
jgi:LuxR family transcriptional regulator of spore coat protein